MKESVCWEKKAVTFDFFCTWVLLHLVQGEVRGWAWNHSPLCLASYSTIKQPYSCSFKNEEETPGFEDLWLRSEVQHAKKEKVTVCVLGADEGGICPVLGRERRLERGGEIYRQSRSRRSDLRARKDVPGANSSKGKRRACERWEEAWRLPGVVLVGKAGREANDIGWGWHWMSG